MPPPAPPAPPPPQQHSPPKAARSSRRCAPPDRAIQWNSMAEATAPPVSARDEQTIEDRVLELVRALAAELGGGRALRALSAQSSLERDAGLGSLERVELLLRLEAAFGRSLDEAALQADTPAQLARAV